MLSSGQTTVSTNGTGSVVLIAVPAARHYNYLRIVNEGAAPGSFSPDNGGTWGRIPAATPPYSGATSLAPAVVEVFGTFNGNVLIQRSGSSDMSGVSGHCGQFE